MVRTESVVGGDPTKRLRGVATLKRWSPLHGCIVDEISIATRTLTVLQILQNKTELIGLAYGGGTSTHLEGMIKPHPVTHFVHKDGFGARDTALSVWDDSPIDHNPVELWMPLVIIGVLTEAILSIHQSG